MQVKLINNLSELKAGEELRRCCGSSRWVEQMCAARPFASTEDMFDNSERIWWNLTKEDWLEAFNHHPKIGDVENLKKRFANTADWSKGEQKGVDAAPLETLQALAAGNKAYEAKFGYIFIVCATGKSAGEMLSILQRRLDNDAGDEIKIAAGEQSKITHLRLEKLCQEVQSQPTS